MVVLAERFSKFYSRLQNDPHRHNHLQPEDFSDFLRDFELNVSNSLNQLLLNPDPRSEFFSFPRIHQLLKVISVINIAFAKLVMNLEHPIHEWKTDSVDEYLNYTLNLLDLFNCTTSSLTRLSQERIILSCALIRVQSSPSSAIGRLKPIQPKKLNKILHKNENKETEKEGKRKKPTKDSIIRQALRVLQGIGIWVCGISVAGLTGDEKPYLESRKSAMEIEMYTINRLDSEIYKEGSQKNWVLKEIRDINDAVGRLIAAIDGGESSEAEKEVGRKVEEFQKHVEEIDESVNWLFSEVLAGRTQILDSFAMGKEENW